MESSSDYVFEDEDFPEVEIDISAIQPYQFEPLLNQSESESEDKSDSDSDIFDVNTDRIGNLNWWELLSFSLS